MKFFRYLALTAVLLISVAFQPARAQVSIGIGIGSPYAYGPPVCPYGYYGYEPFACTPYGYYGPSYFSQGTFIGAGPWLRHGWRGRGYRPGYYRGYGYRDGYEAYGGDDERYRGGEEFHGQGKKGFYGKGNNGFHGNGKNDFYGGEGGKFHGNKHR
jgi:hypothetical protein